MKDKIFFYTSFSGGPDNPSFLNIKYHAIEYREDGVFIFTYYRDGYVDEFLSSVWTRAEIEKFLEDGTWTQIPAAEAALM